MIPLYNSYMDSIYSGVTGALNETTVAVPLVL